jgi:hypothetical protein
MWEHIHPFIMFLNTAALSRRKPVETPSVRHFFLLLFVGSLVKMANSNRRVSCGLDFCSISDIRGSLQGASEAG